MSSSGFTFSFISQEQPRVPFGTMVSGGVPFAPSGFSFVNAGKQSTGSETGTTYVSGVIQRNADKNPILPGDPVFRVKNFEDDGYNDRFSLFTPEQLLAALNDKNSSVWEAAKEHETDKTTKKRDKDKSFLTRIVFLGVCVTNSSVAGARWSSFGSMGINRDVSITNYGNVSVTNKWGEKSLARHRLYIQFSGNHENRYSLDYISSLLHQELRCGVFYVCEHRYGGSISFTDFAKRGSDGTIKPNKLSMIEGVM